MTDKTSLEKLRVLLPHWIDHSRSHQEEFKKWQDLVRQEGHAEIADLIAKAVATVAETDACLAEALTKAGGSLADHNHHHHHHGHGE